MPPVPTRPDADVTVTLAGPDDLDHLVAISIEMERFYEGDQAIDPATIRDRLRDGLFAPEASAEALIVRAGGAPAGLALFSASFPTRNMTRGLFVKDIFVAEAMRQRGVGAAIVRGLARIARDRDLGTVEWTTAIDNVAAQALYYRLKVPQETVVAYHLDGETLLKLAEE